jgi:hypothetical protein
MRHPETSTMLFFFPGFWKDLLRCSSEQPIIQQSWMALRCSRADPPASLNLHPICIEILCSYTSGPSQSITLYGVTMIFRTPEWLTPEVAVTVTLEKPGGVPVLGFGCGLPPPQLATSKASAMIPKTAEKCLAFLPRLFIPTTKNPNTIPSDHEVNVQRWRAANGTAAALGAVVLRVRVVETGDPLGVTLAGEKAQLEAAGRPLQAKVTGEFMPLTGLMVMVNVAL